MANNVLNSVIVKIMHNVFLRMELAFALLATREKNVRRNALRELMDRTALNDVNAKMVPIARKKPDRSVKK